MISIGFSRRKELSANHSIAAKRLAGDGFNFHMKAGFFSGLRHLSPGGLRAKSLAVTDRLVQVEALDQDPDRDCSLARNREGGAFAERRRFSGIRTSFVAPFNALAAACVELRPVRELLLLADLAPGPIVPTVVQFAL